MTTYDDWKTTDPADLDDCFDPRDAEPEPGPEAEPDTPDTGPEFYHRFGHASARAW
jgi:hypothetical protein